MNALRIHIIVTQMQLVQTPKGVSHASVAKGTGEMEFIAKVSKNNDKFPNDFVHI